ncbi:hypothetical protein TWF481_004778 [Arthrobotrys musiformis]|uniref:Flavoprotein domain-containing protein n=1 Tax=Arthrobotrys musiformis TaxID=47236 RepID=A0AAV9WKY9_9PEZI
MPPHASPSDIPTPKTAFKASSHASDGKTHILLAATGSVASIKIPLILSSLSKYSNISIRLVFTTSSLLFLPPLTELLEIPNVDGIHLDHHEWPEGLSSTPTEAELSDTPEAVPSDTPEAETAIWAKIGDPILHIELRRWADILIIAPLSANSLAKIVGGFSDNLLLSVVRAWDVGKVIAVAPAMNTLMWDHPVTGRQIGVLEGEWGWFRVLRPVEKVLACGDSGSGAMKEWSSIVEWVVGEMKLTVEEGV